MRLISFAYILSFMLLACNDGGDSQQNQHSNSENTNNTPAAINPPVAPQPLPPLNPPVSTINPLLPPQPPTPPVITPTPPDSLSNNPPPLPPQNNNPSAFVQTIKHASSLASAPSITDLEKSIELLKAKAASEGTIFDINEVSNDAFKQTALQRAVLSNKLDHIKVLIQHGADPNIGNPGDEPIRFAVLQAGTNNSKLVDYLLTLETLNINAPDSLGNTALTSAIMTENKDVAEKLLNAKAIVNTKDIKAALTTKNTEIIDLFITKESRADTLKDIHNSYYTPFIEANNTELLKRLVDKGAKFSEDQLKLALELKSDKDALAMLSLIYPTLKTKTPRAKGSHRSLMRFSTEEVKTGIIDPTLLPSLRLNALKKGFIDSARFLLRYNSSKEEQIIRLFTKSFDDTLAVENLLNNGLNPNAAFGNIDMSHVEHRPVNYIIRKNPANAVETIALLVSKGADINAADTVHNVTNATPLLLAVDKQHIAIVKKLLELGANPNNTAGLHDKSTILHMLVAKPNLSDKEKEIIEILFQATDRSLKNKDGKTFFQVWHADNNDFKNELARKYPQAKAK